MCVSVQFHRGRFRFRFRFLENGSGGSGSAFGSCENGSVPVSGSGSVPGPPCKFFSNLNVVISNPVLPFLVFLEFLVFFPCEDFLVFLSVFPFFSRDFRGSVGIKNPCFFCWFSLPFSKKKQGKEGQGCYAFFVPL